MPSLRAAPSVMVKKMRARLAPAVDDQDGVGDLHAGEIHEVVVLDEFAVAGRQVAPRRTAAPSGIFSMSFCRRAAYSALSNRSGPVVAAWSAAAGRAENKRNSRTGTTAGMEGTFGLAETSRIEDLQFIPERRLRGRGDHPERPTGASFFVWGMGNVIIPRFPEGGDPWIAAKNRNAGRIDRSAGAEMPETIGVDRRSVDSRRGRSRGVSAKPFSGRAPATARPGRSCGSGGSPSSTTRDGTRVSSALPSGSRSSSAKRFPRGGAMSGHPPLSTRTGRNAAAIARRTAIRTCSSLWTPSAASTPFSWPNRREPPPCGSGTAPTASSWASMKKRRA